MTEQHNRPPVDIRVRNVSLHSRGKTENGALYLTNHHLIFSYVPASPGPSRESSDINAQKNGARVKARPKEIWVPYPMINHCILRPGHAQGQTLKAQPVDYAAETPPNGDHAFPPVYGTSSFGRPSTDSMHFVQSSPSPRTSLTETSNVVSGSLGESGWPPALRLRRRDFQMMAFHFHPSSTEKSADESAREVFYALRGRCCVDGLDRMHAFHFKPPQEETAAVAVPYDARREFARMGIGGKAADGPGSAWRLTDINHDYSYSKTYPSVLCVPRTVSDNLLKYGGTFRSKSRIPALTYLHSNGGSITRSSQPMVGVQNRRNPQDERLVSAIFSSHRSPVQSPDGSPRQAATATIPSVTAGGQSGSSEDVVPPLSLGHGDTASDEKLGGDQGNVVRKKIYGTTRRNLIVDARPKINALANRATGGGIEDTANYSGTGETPVEKFFLNIANIHVMRASLEKVIDSFANSDYVDMRPDQERLRKSAWLSHISNLLDGSEMVARVVGLGGSHVLVHCSDGWDRTAQVAALAEIMLDPHYRTLNGFITLVQKDFLSFGHKFKDRSGIEGSEKWFEIENERITPSRTKDSSASDTTSLNTLGSKALSGARTWFEKNRGSLFRQQNDSRSSLQEDGSSRPPSPPPNPIIHASPPVANSKDDKEHKEHKMSEKEIAPIFHQFLDAVFQLQYQNPNAFEFNERFLRRLFYQAYSGQYGEFLFNCEEERLRHRERTHSVWPHFLSRRQEFVNPDYVSKAEDPLLFPKRQGVEREVDVRWWSGLFQRKEEDMNTARSLAPPDPDMDQPPSLSTQTSGVASDDGSSVTSAKAESASATTGAIKEARSMPNFDSMREGISSTFASLKLGSSPRQAPTAATASSASRPFLEQRDTDPDVLNKYIDSSTAAAESSHDTDQQGVKAEQAQPETGDPLGVSHGNAVQDFQHHRMDFAAFSQSTYSSR